MNAAEDRLIALRTDLQKRFPVLHGSRPPKSAKPPALRIDPTAIILGRDDSRAPVGLGLRVRQEHCFILGTTGSGKSRLLLHFIRQAIKNGEGALFLDPHGNHAGSGYSELISWLMGQGRRVHVIDPNSTKHTVGFNPLACPAGTDVSVVAGNVLDALSVSWEGESFAQKPTIERVLTVVFSALAELGLTMVEAPMLLDHKDEYGLRLWAIQNVKDRYTRDELHRLHELAQDGRRRRDFDQETVGPMNRLQRLLRPQAIRAMLGQTSGVLDMKSAMDNGDIVLANLSGGSRVYERDADLFGRLLIRDTLFHAKRRENGKPFTVMLDEAHRFLSNDIPTLLAEVRKYGVSIVAAMQWLEQANTEDEKLLAALLNGTNAKICFRMRDAEQSERFAHSNVPLDLEVPVATLSRPAVVGHKRIKLNSESRTEQEIITESAAFTEGVIKGVSETRGETFSFGTSENSGVSESRSTSSIHSSSHGESAATGDGSSAGEVLIPTGEFWSPLSTSAETAGTTNIASSGHSSSSTDGSVSNTGMAKSHGQATSEGYASSYSISSSRAESRAKTRGQARSTGTGLSAGFSEALEPIIEWLPSSVHSKDNMLYRAGQMLLRLPTGYAYLNYVGQAGPVSTLFTVPPIFTETIPPEDFAQMRDNVMANSPAAISSDDALVRIEQREEALLARTRPAPSKPASKKRQVAARCDEPGTWG